ncbi:MAG: polyphenol oxidase family protein [Bdellovibrio sp.]|nr:polyphenol oxidase family protein [Bdellovibrio sp.]
MAVLSKTLSKIQGLKHGFGTFEEKGITSLQEFWPALPRWNQVHGVSWADLVRPNQDCGEVDALISETPGIPVTVRTGDCVPILLAHKDAKCIAAIHAGWKGTRDRIVPRVWSELERRGHQAKDWVGVVGPAIGPCCYQVSEELAESFKTQFRHFDSNLIIPRPRQLDLPYIHLEGLKELGLGEVECLRYCTFCSTEPRFHSARRTQKFGKPASSGEYLDRQYSGLVILN